MLSVRLSGKSRLLAVKFWESHKLAVGFQLHRVSTPKSCIV